MATQLKSREELYEIYKNAAQQIAETLTDWNEGSINDSQGGAASIMASELTNILIQEFKKTFIQTADGPEVTGSSDDLQTLMVDHFGDDFSRPEAQLAVGTVKFSRPTTGAGDVTIPAGTVIASDVDANGESVEFETLVAVEMTGLEINASIEAKVAGVVGNVGTGDIVNITSTLTDPTIVVTNESDTGGGAEIATDEEYRQFTLNKIQTLKGGVKEAVEAVALNVSGIETASAIEKLQNVIEWDVGGSTSIGAYFQMPHSFVYVADANGEANDALIALVESAVDGIRATGVKVTISSATAVSIDWDASITLNPSGPNFTEFQNDTSQITDSMTKYINDLETGSGFDRDDAKTFMLAIWGPSGTDDLTADGFEINTPTGDVSLTEAQKTIAGTIGTS